MTRLAGLRWMLVGAGLHVGNSVGWPATVSALHQFSTLDKEEQAGMLLASDGALYGTTLGGGANGQGTLFKWTPQLRQCQVLYHFSQARNPGALLAETKEGDLLGATAGGGSGGLGTVFKIDKAGARLVLLHQFTALTSDGRVPFSGLRQGKERVWFGTTDEGGASGAGTVYRLNEDGTQFRVVHHFGGHLHGDGEKPRGTLCRGTNGQWYGTSVGGPMADCGTIFTLDDEGNHYRILHAFAGPPTDGMRPYAGLVEGNDGKLYGTTVAGGQGSQGTVFRMMKDGSAYKVVHAFTGVGDDGRNPYAGLVEAQDGKWYGATLNGGARGCGVLFRVNGDGSGYETLFSFSDRAGEGRGPYAGLSLAADGTFYGATTGGASKGAGAIYSLQP